MKQKILFIIFKGLSVVTNCLRRVSGPLSISSVNVTKSTGNCGFANLTTFTEKNP